ncbi:MAG: response regulator transcription factor [Ruminococcus sp.]|nr:response regulator transcription factor [Ruminococcus sp.]
MSVVYCLEDDDGIRELILCALKSGGYEAEGFPTANEFKIAIKNKLPDIALLDIMVPDEDGISVLKYLKKSQLTYDVPVIMLTAKSNEIDKVNGLELGADDYITKPFGIMELLSRIKAVLRRSNKQSNVETSVYKVNGLSVDVEKRTVTFADKEITLTFKEYEILVYLLKNRGIAVSRDKLMSEVWGFEYEGESRTVDVHIKTLRQKIEAQGCENPIITVRGFGYKIK